MSWDERYQNDDTPWDKGAPAPPLLDLLQEHRSFFGNDAVLVPGCGTGHDARAIAAASLPVIGIDLSPTALQRAQNATSPASLRYREMNFLTAQPGELPPLSAIFEHTCFCAILPEERPLYAEACERLLPSGGYWAAIIFIKPREIDDPSIGPPYQSSRQEIVSLFKEHFILRYETIPQNTFKERQGKERIMVWQKK